MTCTSGDPATDLAVAWRLFDPKQRIDFRRAYGNLDDDTWRRSRGWALHFALGYLADAANHPLMTSIGQRTLMAVLTDEDRRENRPVSAAQSRRSSGPIWSAVTR